MTDETKKLFDAPWEVGVCEKGNPEFESLFVASKTGCLIARDMEEETANRIARLPELYDALVAMVSASCIRCRERQTYWHFDVDTFISKGCPCLKRGDCLFKSYWDLIRKVRNGER